MDVIQALCGTGCGMALSALLQRRKIKKLFWGWDPVVANILVSYLTCACLLALYSPEVSPVLAEVGYPTSIIGWIITTSISILFRLLLLRRNRERIATDFLKNHEAFLSIPSSEIRSDALVWTANGLCGSGVMSVLYGISWQSFLEITFGCAACGILIGILNFLDMEREVTLFIQAHQDASVVPPQRPVLSIPIKFSFLLVTAMSVSAVVIVFMWLDDIRSLKESLALGRSWNYGEMLYEMVIVTVVMVIFSVLIIRKFSRNLSMLFGIQIETLRKVEKGEYNSRAPIVSTDEFGVIAGHTNAMISGLAERDFIRETFGRYVTKEVRDLILSKKIPLDGETRNVTIMFCDIRRFTSHVAAAPAAQVVKRLNEYFTEMTRAIEDHKGLVLQFIGDEIEAVFGAPLYVENHPEMALAAAVDMRRRLFQLNRRWRRNEQVSWEHGIGIHTGDVLAGNIGSADRLSYLMVGDTVNLASRIQELTKKFACDILISAGTKSRIPGQDKIRHVGTETARGMGVETDLYQVL